ncbi:MAG: hypothetical protein ACYC0V_18380 [Armatimonadota bacterium]
MINISIFVPRLLFDTILLRRITQGRRIWVATIPGFGSRTTEATKDSMPRTCLVGNGRRAVPLRNPDAVCGMPQRAFPTGWVTQDTGFGSRTHTCPK